MNNSILISVGHPVGTLTIDEGLFYLETYSGMYMLNNPVFYFIWTKCINGITYESLINLFKDTFDDEVILDDYLAQLIDNKFIALFEIDDNIKNYENIKNYKIARTGLGIGATDDSSTRHIILGENRVEIEAFEYSIWFAANGKFTIADIIEGFRENMNIGDEEIIKIITAIVSLCNEGLLILMGE